MCLFRFGKRIVCLFIFLTHVWPLMGYERVNLLERKAQIQVSARALVVKDQKLLLVGHSPEYWYTPGGRLEIGENLTDCLIREVFEETGIKVKTGRLYSVELEKRLLSNKHIELFSLIEV